jgi:hypothetical protein
LLTRYELVGLHGSYLQLRQRGQIAESDPLSAAGAPVTYRFGRKIAVPAGSAPELVEIHIKPSLLGKLANVFYKRHPLSITVNLENGEVRSYRIVAGMAESGFLISPLVEDTKDFGALYGGADLLAHKRVASFVINHTHGKLEWDSMFSVSFRKLELPPAQPVKTILGVEAPLTLGVPVSPAPRCEGSFDTLNGVPPGSQAMRIGSWLSASGWMARSAGHGDVPGSLVLVLSNDEGQSIFFKAKRTPRPDVGAYFKQPAMDMSGYAAAADLTGLKGEYTLGLAYPEGDHYELCALPTARVSLGN